MKTPITRQAATKYAEQLKAILQPVCTLFEFAGSYRRECQTVGDLELCALLPRENRTRAGMEIMKIARIVKGTLKADARYIQLSLKENALQVDLFLPTPSDFFRQLAIRTGSAEYSKYIAVLWVQLGWVGTQGGLRRRSECRETSAGWECIAPFPTLPPAWETEREFFDFLGMPYLEPNLRHYGL